MHTLTFGNLLLGLTTLTYIGLAIFNLQKINATGDRLVGWGFLFFGLIAVYVFFSLLLTINIATKGGFNWISSSTSTRNIVVGLLWLGMVFGVAFCAMLSTEFQTDESTGIFRLLTLPVFFGSLWLPLLMAVSVSCLLKTRYQTPLNNNWKLWTKLAA